MEPRVAVPPADEPITLEEVKADLRIDFDDDNGRLERYIADAREWIEKRLQLSLMTQTRELLLDAFPSAPWRLPFGPVQSIEALTYDDSAGVSQTVTEADYRLSDSRLTPISAWPDGKNIVVQFVSGFETADRVPGPIKSALRLKVQEFYDGNDNGRRINDLLTNYYLMVA